MRLDDLRLVDYKPVSKLVLPRTEVLKPRFPVIDAHNHLGEQFGGGWDRRPVGELLSVLDAAGVTLLVDLDGGFGEDLLDSHLRKFKDAAPERFQVFGGIDWSRWSEEGNRFGEEAAKRFTAQVRRGAQGLKVWKVLGLHVRDHRGMLVTVDDERLDPIWAAAGELHVPVVIHAADPVAFFDPLGPENERYEELLHHPEWSFSGEGFPSFLEIIAGFERLIARHPAVTFIGAHVGCYPENLGWVRRMLSDYPNFQIDISARIAELGRQPYRARRLFLDFPDRILFAMDVAPRLDWYRLAYRFLETADEHFDYDPTGFPGQGRWRICGLNLPDEVLEKVYCRNAARLLNNVAKENS